MDNTEIALSAIEGLRVKVDHIQRTLNTLEEIVRGDHRGNHTVTRQEEPKKRKYKFSTTARKRQSAMMKKRWAEWRKRQNKMQKA